MCIESENAIIFNIINIQSIIIELIIHIKNKKKKINNMQFILSYYRIRLFIKNGHLVD